MPANGSTITNRTPTYSGTGDANSTIVILVDNALEGSTSANGSGGWSYTQGTLLTNGSHTVRAYAIDYAGNKGADSSTNTFTVDTIPPAAPVVSVPSNGGATSDSTPAYTGTAEANSTVTLYVDGANEVGTTVANGAGIWNFTQPSPLSEGNHTVYATAKDSVGNTSVNSNTNTFMVDLTPPAAPVVVMPANGSTTNDDTPAYSGTAEAASTINVVVDGAPVGTTTADGSGNWSYTPGSALAEGSHTILATAADTVENTSANSNTNTFTVDTTPPAAPVLIAPANGSVTTFTMPTIMGTAEPGSTVTVFINGALAGTANGSGNWDFTPSSPLADAVYTITAKATDAYGNTSDPSAEITYTVDTVGPDVPVVLAPADSSYINDDTIIYSGTAEPDSLVVIFVDDEFLASFNAEADGSWSYVTGANLSEGSHTMHASAWDEAGNASSNTNTITFMVDTIPPAAPSVTTPSEGCTTADNTPEITGTAEPGSTVTVYIDGALAGTAVGSSNWSFTPAILAEGSHSVKAIARDAAGNDSADSDICAFTVETPPLAPVVNSPAHNSRTNDSTPTITGTAQAGSTVTVFIDLILIDSVTAEVNGSWSYTLSSALTEGEHEVIARATDAGGPSPLSNANTFTVDLTPPTPVVVTPANGSSTNDTTPTYSGTCEVGSVVTIYLNGVNVGTCISDALNNWSLTLMSELGEGSNNIKVTAEDDVGNISGYSNTNTFIVDITPPAPPMVVTPVHLSQINDSTPTFSGTAEQGSTVTIYVFPNPIGTTIADGSGNWSFTPTSAIPDGSNLTWAEATDAALNTSIPSDPVMIFMDTLPPDAPIISEPEDGVLYPFNDIQFAGTAENLCTVTIELDGTTVGTAPASDLWAFLPSVPLADGTHSVRAFSTDEAGNIGAYSDTITFTVDTTTPLAPVVSTPANGSVQGDAYVIYTGTAEPLSNIMLIVDEGIAGGVTTDSFGDWSFDPGIPLTDGTHTVKATATDAAGHTSDESNTNTFTVDTVPPAAPIVITPANGSLLNDSTPACSGTAEAGSTVTVFVGGAAIGTAATDMSGNWSFTVPVSLPDGIHSVKAQAMDASENTSVDSNTNTFTLDATPPAAPIVSTPISGSILGMAMPICSGEAEASSTVIVTVDGAVLCSIAANSEQRWTCAPPLPLADGVHTIYAVSVDTAGNTSAASATHTFTVDTTPPAAPVVSSPVSGSTVYDYTPLYVGTAEANSVVTIEMDGATAGSVNAGADGHWSFTQPISLTEGNHTVKAMAMDSAENEGPYSATITFTVRELVPVSIAAIPGVTPPEKGAAPASHIIATSQYTGTVAWSPNNVLFAPATVYTATITLSAKAGYTLIGVSKDFFTVQGAASTANSAGSGIVTAVFPATAPDMYTVTFTSKDAVYATRTVISGTSIGSAGWPEAPVRSGYTFGGWYTGVNGSGSRFTSVSVVLAAITVYAKWTKDTVSSGDEPTPTPAPTPVPVQVLLNGSVADVVSVVPAQEGSVGQVLVAEEDELTAMMQPNFSLVVSSIAQQPAQPALIAPLTLETLFGSILGNQPVPSSASGNAYESMAALTFPSGLLHAQDGSGALTYNTDIGSVTLPSNLLAWDQGPAVQPGAGTTLTILSGTVAALQGLGGAPGGNVQLFDVTLSMDGSPVLQLNPDAPVLLSIIYSADGIPQGDLSRLAVVHIDENGVVTYLPNSHYNMETGTMDFSTTLLGSFAVVFGL